MSVWIIHHFISMSNNNKLFPCEFKSLRNCLVSIDFLSIPLRPEFVFRRTHTVRVVPYQQELFLSDPIDLHVTLFSYTQPEKCMCRKSVTPITSYTNRTVYLLRFIYLYKSDGLFTYRKQSSRK